MRSRGERRSMAVAMRALISLPMNVRSGSSVGRCSRWRSKKRSEEHTSELQSPCNLVCRLLLEKKKKVIPHLLLYRNLRSFVLDIAHKSVELLSFDLDRSLYAQQRTTRIPTVSVSAIDHQQGRA